MTALRQLLLILLMGTACSACQSIGKPLHIQQGNVVEQEDVQKVKKGMSRQEVAYLLGTPVLENTFEHDRWDYVYSRYQGTQVIRQHHVTIWFNKNVVRSIEYSA